MNDTQAPNCYKCQHRRGLVGSCHSSCNHPSVAHVTTDPLAVILGLLAGAGRAPVGPVEALGVTGDKTGIKNGWFVWPVNFDPTWLRSCDGFEPVTERSEQNATA